MPADGAAPGSPRSSRPTLFAAEDDTERGLLLRRARLLLGVATAVGLVVTLVSHTVLADVESTLPVLDLRPSEVWWDVMSLSVMAGAFASLWVGHPGAPRIQQTVLAAFALGVVLISTASVDLLFPTTFWVGLVLLLPAALVPWRVSYQAALAGSTLVIFVAGQLWGYGHPEARQYWADYGGAQGFTMKFTMDIILIAIIGATTVLVTWTLYRLRRTVAEARQLGDYRLHRKLGEGGMGVVWEAQHARMCRPSAVKVLVPQAGDEDRSLAKFEREIRLSSELDHPNTVRIFDYGRAADDTFYFAMEYLEGMDLHTLVSRTGPLPPARVRHILLQVCASLREAHDKGIIHRDLKPSNVFVTCMGGVGDFVKVLDFGLAKQVREGVAPEVTQTGEVFGTPEYFAPEMADGSDRADARSDIYCLGALAYWTLAGVPPFRAESSLAVISAHLTKEADPVSTHAPHAVPPELEALVLRCLAKDPGKRYQTVAELARALEALSLESEWTLQTARGWWEEHGAPVASPRT